MATKFTVILKPWDDQPLEADNLFFAHVEITDPRIPTEELALLREAIRIAYEHLWETCEGCWLDEDQMRDESPVVAIFAGHHQDRLGIVTGAETDDALARGKA